MPSTCHNPLPWPTSATDTDQVAELLRAGVDDRERPTLINVRTNKVKKVAPPPDLSPPTPAETVGESPRPVRTCRAARRTRPGGR
ncbi:hypothetical protein OG301_33815 [Streptomyces platensis]|uniref:hypothetical protein n=1 Tax=Streptomyces platensis TaxID=58346 RepID=UPI002ED2101C|nr:hypothetical protein OG301_33815 [Streptomyces platensis]